MVRFLFILLISSFLFSCKPSRYDDIKNKLRETKNIDLDNYKAVFVTSEIGCIGCNISFFKLITHYLDNNEILIINGATGAICDISKLKSEKISTIFPDEAYEIFGTDLSTALFFSNKQIDTSLIIKAVNLEKQLIYIREKVVDL